MSRIDNLKKQHPELNVSVIDLLAKVDPTESYKYTEFLVKKIKEWFGGETEETTHIAMGIELIGEENTNILNEFEVHSRAGRIKKNDIGQHKDFDSLLQSVKEADEILKQKEAEKQVIKLMDTDEYCVVVPLSYEASKIYGAGTKWCTTQEKYWLDYIGKYKLIYIIKKTTNEKYAISRMKDNNTKIQAWLSNDDETSPFLLPLPPEVMTIVTDEIRKNECVKDLMKKDTVVENYGMNNLMEYMQRYLSNSHYGSLYNASVPQESSQYSQYVNNDSASYYQAFRDALSTISSVDESDEQEIDDTYSDDEDDTTDMLY